MSAPTRYVCLFVILLWTAQSQSSHPAWLQSFDQVWQTVADKHWDPNYNGLNWAAMRDEYRPKVETASTAEAARALISAMLDRLGHSHIGLIPEAAYEDLAPGRGEGQARLGFEVIEGQAVLSSDPYRGWILKEVNRRPVAEPIARSRSPLAARMSVLNLLRGDVGDTLDLRLEDPVGRIHAAGLKLEAPDGKLVRFGELPPLRLELHFEKLSSRVGYIRFSSFFDPNALMALFERAVRECATCRGMIIDLRGNLGGLGALAASVAGWFLDEPASLGTCHFRTGQIRLLANPRPQVFPGRLAILINPASLSTSEFLARGLQDLGRARIFGQPSSGMALPSSMERLPMGDGFQYTTANYVSAGGKAIEGIGVQPDVVIHPTRKQLIDGQDPVLAAATSWIEHTKFQE